METVARIITASFFLLYAIFPVLLVIWSVRDIKAGRGSQMENLRLFTGIMAAVVLLGLAVVVLVA